MVRHIVRHSISRAAAAVFLFVCPALAEGPDEPLTLDHARMRALARNPDLAGAAAEVRARAAGAAQAGLLPNPELRADFENVGGTGAREGVEQTESTLRVSQLIELGGKRDRRRRVATLERDAAHWALEARQRAVVGDTTKAFVRALAAQERVALATQLEEIARRAVASVTAQVEAGAAPGVEITRARVVAERSTIDRYRAERALAAARRALALTWGEDDTFGRLAGDLTLPRALPAIDDLDTSLHGNADLARADADTEERTATLALQAAARIPDVTLGAGARHFSDNGDYALVFEVSAPIPVFDRNQGGIAAAQSRLDQALAEREALRIALRAALTTAYAALATAHDEATRLHDGVLPTAERAFEQARTAYRQGLFRFVDVLDAQRTLFEVRGDHLAALETVHLAAADIEQLTGRALFDAPAGGEAP